MQAPKSLALGPTYSVLNKREGEILEMIGRGMNNMEIAKALDLSEATIKHYVTPLFRKIGVQDRTDAALKVRGL